MIYIIKSLVTLRVTTYQTAFFQDLLKFRLTFWRSVRYALTLPNLSAETLRREVLGSERAVARALSSAERIRGIL